MPENSAGLRCYVAEWWFHEALMRWYRGDRKPHIEGKRK